MELLILKSGDTYFRVKDGEYLKCGMDKASVFPLDKKETVFSHMDELKKMGEQAVAIHKLTIIETPYEED